MIPYEQLAVAGGVKLGGVPVPGWVVIDGGPLFRARDRRAARLLRRAGYRYARWRCRPECGAGERLLWGWHYERPPFGSAVATRSHRPMLPDGRCP
jgi:hypothetical protein